ncbi:3'(2'),5'-bisphosphate nucleotidase 1-like [Macrobrachium nipponense]|uniref:3'(2'),5'-bisphosphate nucleotidase 1-like n=1 Tax=Macrobrachium nipponense TaxID=159736 RepID=UPI0030C86CD9
MALAQNMPLLSRLVSSSVAIASHAGGIIRDILKKGELGIVEKENASDLQTEADRAAQRCIISSLNKCFPKITIIGEEGEEETQNTGDKVFDPDVMPAVNVKCPSELSSLAEEEIVVWVDPLDGTAEYTQAHRLGELHHLSLRAFVKFLFAFEFIFPF